MNYRKKIVISVTLVAVAMIISYSLEVYRDFSQVNDKVIRLHLLANSDSQEDQDLKYHVRDRIISKFNQEFKDIRSKEESSQIIFEKIHQIREETEEIIRQEGYDYQVDVYYGNYKFPRKNYDEILLPQGYYDAVRIEIGQGEGANWWCVMFPPLCFVDFGKSSEATEPVFTIETEASLQGVLSDQEIQMIRTKRGIENIKLKSKIFEFIEKGRIGKIGKTYATSLSK